MKKIYSFFLLLIIFPLFPEAQNFTGKQAKNSKPDVEAYNHKLDTCHILQKVMEKTGASFGELKLFCQYYRDTIQGVDKGMFGLQVRNRQIVTDADVQSYADKKVEHYCALYKKFDGFLKDYPETVNEYLTQRQHRPKPELVCNPACDNLDFENGSLSAWTACYASNVSTSSSFANTNPICFGPLGNVVVAAYDPSTSSNQVSLTSGAGFDPIAGALIPVVCPIGGKYSCMVGDGTIPYLGVAILEQTWMVTKATANLTYMYAVVLENPQSHTYYEQPYFQIELLDQNGNPISGCGQYSVVSAPGLPGYTGIYYPADGDTVYCKPWTTEFLPLQAYIGQCVTIRVLASDCSLSGHFGYGYFDATCSPIGIITSSPAICGSSNVTLTGPNGAAGYLWSGPCIVGANNTQTITVSCPGTYSLNVTSNIGSSCTDTMSVTIVSSPPLASNLVSTTNNICNGGKAGTATVSASGGTSPYTYSWSPAAGTNTTATGLSAGSYTAYIRDAAGCLDSIPFTITQPTGMTISTSTTNIGCTSPTGTATATVSNGTPNYNYLWSPSGNTNATASGLSVGTYTVTVTDSKGCTITDSAVVTSVGGLTVTIPTNTGTSCFGGADGTANSANSGGAGPYVYAWTPSGGAAANATGLSAGIYTVTVTDSKSCVGTASVIITQPAQITVVTTGTQIICSGQPANFSATASNGTAPYNYSWSNGVLTANNTASPLVSTIYTVTATDANGCTASSTASVLIEPSFTLAVSGAASLCPGQSTTLIASTSGGSGNYSYNWLPGNANSPSITVSPSTTTTYTLTVADGCGSSTVMAQVVVNAQPTVNLTADINTGCVPLCIQFRDLSSIPSGRISQWEWNFGNGDSSSSENPIYCYPDSGRFNVSLTAVSDNGCSSTYRVLKMITVYPHPKASFTYSPQYVDILNPLVQFTNNSFSAYPIVYWLWNFGDGNSNKSELENPSHLYSDTGTYCADLSIMDEHGCQDTAENCIVVNPLFSFYIPDAFTPNGDGVNDVFKPKGSYIKDFDMYIFDRWGMQVFHSNTIENGWNGTNHGGSVCQQDTYIYSIKVTDSKGIQHSYVGNVTLLK